MTMMLGNSSSPANEAAAVTKSDSTVFPVATRGLYVGGTGNVTVTMAGGVQDVVEFEAVPAGAILPISVTQVRAATTATLIVRMW